MGFDNECIVNIQSLAGEYFCPVCRLLVYPNEAMQSQCTHLYCKPCLTYVVGTTRACPYDGYLVTEPDSKPLLESNKALAETIGKIAVRCLYHRSGCQWQGPLSDSTTHCSGCAFGNSAVVCNRCAIQIVHRQVQEHAQTCPGVPPQATQAEGTQNLAATGTAAPVNVGQPQTATHQGATNSVAPQTGAVPAASQDPNLQASVNSQVNGVAVGAVPTPEQLYYQLYYQQFPPPGYDPSMQAYQNYYPYPQQPQQVPQMPIQSQTPVQPQAPPQAQGQAQPQTLQNVNPYYQTPQATQPPQPMMPQVQQPSQGYPYPYPQPQSYPGSQPLQQLPQPPQMPQPQMQQHHPQMPPQPHPHAQPQQLQAQSHSHPQPTNQSLNSNAQPQAQQQLSQAVTGHHSYPPQPQTQPQMPMTTQQRPNMHPQTGPIPQHPPHPYGQYPPQSHPPVPNQQFPPPSQVPVVPPAHQRPPVNIYSQQPGLPPMQPMQQPMPHQQSFSGQASGPIPNQLRPQGQLPPPPPMHPQLHPGQQPQSYSGRPVMPNYEAQPPPFAQSLAGYPGQAQGRPPHNLGENQHFPSQNHQLRTNNSLQTNESPSLTAAEKEINGLASASGASGLGTESVEAKSLKDARDVKLGGNEDAKDTGSGLHKAESISVQPAGNGGSSFETGAAEQKEVSDVSQKGEKLTLGDKSKEGGADTRVQAEGSAKREKNNHGQLHNQVLGHSSGQPTHPFPSVDQDRGSYLPMQYPPTHQQRPSGPPMLQPALPPGPPHHAQMPGQPPNMLRPQGLGHLPQPGQPFNLHSDHGPHPPFGRPPSQFIPHERNFELQHSAGPRMPSGKPTGSFNSSSGFLGRTPLFGAEGRIDQQRPIGLAGNEIFPDPRPRYLDGLSPGTQSQGKNLKEALGTDSSHGMYDERFTPLTDRVSRTLDKEPFGLITDTGSKLESGAVGAPRFLPPYYTGGVNEPGGRLPQVGPDSNIGRGNFAHARPEFLRPVPEFGVHRMDRFASRSPGRENAGFAPRDFGELPGFPRNRSSMGHFEGRESHLFDGGPRPFSHFQRGELEGPGFQGPRSVPGRLLMGDPAGFAAFPGPARMGDLSGPENFPPYRPFSSSYPSDGGLDPFGNSRKRLLPNNGWCRICKTDCEGVEGLELHSQTREHQAMAMDMVRGIKQQNAKKQKMPNRSSLEEPSKRRGAAYEVHGNGR